jgi:hypothetical protein
VTYETMLANTASPWCWACGRSDYDRPPWWSAPWLIERAHICNKPRRLDVRAVVLLCSACHRTSHGERLVRWSLPKLTLENLLWIKLMRDPEGFDPEFLQTSSVRLLPSPVQPPLVYLKEYASRHREIARQELREYVPQALPEQLPDESDSEWLERIKRERT